MTPAFLESMSQLFRDLNFGAGSEARRRIPVGAMIVQFNLEHSGLLPLEKLADGSAVQNSHMLNVRGTIISIWV